MQEQEQEKESVAIPYPQRTTDPPPDSDISPATRHWTGFAVWATMLLLDAFANATINVWLYGLPACLMLGEHVTHAAGEVIASLIKTQFGRRK